MTKAKVKAKPKKVDYVMSPSELQGLVQEKNDDKRVLKSAEEGAGSGTKVDGMIDKGALKASINKYDRLILKHSPKKMTGKTKDSVAKRAKELGEFIRSGMPTSQEMNDLHTHPGTPYKNLKWEKEKGAAIQEWKQCQRRLEPGDPTASTVERLRSR